ncbi:unnamed protein product [Closterium sp. NIES-65]|nr:unnamed protein product [Closterium sp. NIES-65]
MACVHINSFPDELLAAIFWPSKLLSSRLVDDDAVWASVLPSPRFLRENADEPCYQQNDKVFPVPDLPPAFADAAYNLLLASICRRWRRLAQRHVSTLLVKKNCAVSCEDLDAAVECFPNLTHLHLSDGSARPIHNAFLARLAASCPKLTAFHLENEIVQNQEYQQPGERFLTRAGFDFFFRQCTRLEHLSLGCLHSDFGLPGSIYQLVRLRSLALADLSALTAPQVKAFSSLAALSINTLIWDYQDLQNLTQLASLTCLSVPREVFLSSRATPPHPFSFAHLSSLRSLDLGYGCPQFDVMFPSDSPCSLLERLSLNQCDDLANLPDDISNRLPSLRELSISDCFMKHPKQVTSLSCLRSLILSGCSFVGLPDSLGEMPALKTLVLDKLSLNFPASCSRLQSLETLVVSECTSCDELRGPLKFPTSLKTLCLAGSPFLVLPDNIGELINLETLFLNMYRTRHQLPSSFVQLASLTRLELQQCELAELPEAMGELRRLRELYLFSCWRIQKLPESLSHLCKLQLSKSRIQSLPSNFVRLTRMQDLDLRDCKQLEALPDDLGELKLLGSLNTDGCDKLHGD